MDSPLTYNQIEDKVIEALEDSLGVKRDSRKDAPHEDFRRSLLVEDLGVESIDYLDITFRLEKDLGINLGIRDFENAVASIRTVQDLIDYITPVCYGYPPQIPQEQPQ